MCNRRTIHRLGARELTQSTPNALSLWLQKGLNALRTPFVKAPVATTPASKSQRQEAEKLRAMDRALQYGESVIEFEPDGESARQINELLNEVLA